MLTYLHLLDLPRGKIVNFGSPKVESQFVNAPFRTSQRRAFQVVDVDYHGADAFRSLVIGLLRDWGTSLTLSHYQEALVTLLGGEGKVEVMLPLYRNGTNLGNQRFCLAEEESAFYFTAMNRSADVFEDQLVRLINYSPLKAIHWVNIEHEIVRLKTVAR